MNSRKNVIAIVAIFVFVVIIIMGFINLFNDGGVVSEKSVNSFNKSFEGYNGVQNKDGIANLLELIIDNNKKENRIITVIYNGKETYSINEIISIKDNLSNNNYEVVFEYDPTAYINRIYIEIKD